LRMFMGLAGYGGDSNVGRHKLQCIIWPHDRWLWCCLLWLPVEWGESWSSKP
jgi:hypothetical protein